MKSFALALALAGVSVPAVSLACEGAAHAAATRVKTVSTAEVAKLVKDKAATPVDANAKDFRHTQGVLPGAIELTSLSYDLKELPADKSRQLVFYCANQHCAASEQAAQRAIEGGYTNVVVMPEGLIGWKKAGQPTARANNS